MTLSTAAIFTMKKYLTNTLLSALLCISTPAFADIYDLSTLSQAEKSQPIHADRLAQAFDAHNELSRLYPETSQTQVKNTESNGYVWLRPKFSDIDYQEWESAPLFLRADESLAIDARHIVLLLNGTAITVEENGDLNLSSYHGEPGLTLVQHMVYQNNQWQADGTPLPVSTAGTWGSGGSAFSIYSDGQTKHEWRFIELSNNHYGFFSESSSTYHGTTMSHLELFDIQGKKITTMLSIPISYDDSGYGKTTDWNDELTARTLKARPSLFKGARSIKEVYEKLINNELDLHQTHILTTQAFHLSPNPSNANYPDLNFTIVETYEIIQSVEDGSRTIARLPERHHLMRYRYSNGSYQLIEGHNPVEGQEG